MVDFNNAYMTQERKATLTAKKKNCPAANNFHFCLYLELDFNIIQCKANWTTYSF
jgi:hypothetical protein